MNKFASLAAIALAAPLLLAAPAEASHQGWHTKTCWLKTADTTLQVRMRFEGSTMKVRVSHPDGQGSFENEDVARVRMHFDFEGVGWVSDDGKLATGGGVAVRDFKGSRPVYQDRYFYSGQGRYTATATFKMDDGKRHVINCVKRFS